MRRLLAICGALIIGIGLASCAPDTTPAPSLVLVNSSNPGTPLVPSVIDTEGGRRIAEMLYSGLVYYDAKGTVANDAAQAIKQEDERNYLVTLRPDQKFSDGQSLTSHNFIDSWDYAFANHLATSHYFDNIANLEAIDDLNFRITLHEPDANFVAKLGQPAYYPMPDSAFEDMAAYSAKPIGNGPYALDEIVPQTSTTMLPNAHYDGPRKVQNDGLKFVYYASPQAAYADLLVNNLDVDDNLDSSQGDKIADRIANYQIAANIQLVLDNGLNIDQRRAISMAIDRSKNTQGLVAATDYSSPLFGVNTNIAGSEYLNYDPVRAKELWDTGLNAAIEAHASAEAQSEQAETEADNPEGVAEEIPAPVSSFDIAVPTAFMSTTSQSSSSLPPGTNTVTSIAEPTTADNLSSEGDLAAETQTPAAITTSAEGSTPTTDVATEVPSIRSGSVDSAERDVVISSLEESLGIAVGTADNDSVFIRSVKAAYPSNQSFLDYYGTTQEELFSTLPFIPLWYDTVRVGHSTYVQNVQIDWRGTPVYYAITKSASK
ncbi:MAG: ABC transporter substrate-binding protein [Corynebacterium sp.]|nr:ABC transporter substrate-binding protein [Corynebacterium sp.]